MSIVKFNYRACIPAALTLAAMTLPMSAQAQTTAQQAPRAAVQQPIDPPPCPEPLARQPSAGQPNVVKPPPGCDPPPPPPPRPPSIPASISYMPYTNDDSVGVSWGRSIAGAGGSVTYSLYESVNNGAWTLVYQGPQTSASFSGKTKSILSYRVRACNSSDSSLCSSYRTGEKMAVNPMVGTDLYAKYPVLHTIDQRNASYQASSKSFPTIVPRAPARGKGGAGFRIMGVDGPRFYLGDGYDVIRGALKEICLDVEHDQFVITKTAPMQPTTFSVTHVTDNRHLAELLDVSASAKVGITFDDFTLGLNAEKERYRKAVTDETHERFVVKWVRRAEFWRLNTPVDAIIPELTSQVLLPGSDAAKADFRERCGDKFINSANLGAAIYLVFTFDSKKYDYNERQSKKGTLGIALGEIFNASGAGSVSSSTELLLQQLNVRVHADQVGGPPGLAATVNASNFAAKFNEFIQGTNIDNWSAVDFGTSNYQRPTAYSAYPQEQIFADFTVPFAQARRWLDITVQNKERCDPYADHNRTRPSQCGTAETELSIALDLCRETRDWVNCQHPAQYYTAFSTISGTYLLGWLNSGVKKLNASDITQNYAHHVHKGELQVNDFTCLRHSQCFVNKFRGTGVGIGQGFTYTQTKYDNPKGSDPQHVLSNLDSCVNTTARLETRKPPFGDTTADLNYTMKVEGFCADNEDFSIVP